LEDGVEKLHLLDFNALAEPMQALCKPLSSDINPTGWQWLGPGNIGGRTRSLLVHPTRPQTIWVAGVSGGVWRTDDSGITWSPLYDFMASLVVSCMILDPTDPEVIYAGTGEGFYNLDGFQGFGIFQSSDAGDSWQQLAATEGPEFRWVNRMAMSHDGTVLLVATRSGLFRSADKGASFTALGAPANQEMLDVRFHPSDAQLCVAGGRNGKAFYSTNGGLNWAPANGLPVVAKFGGRVELSYARANPTVVYVSLDNGTGEIYRSTDGGQTYALRGRPGHLSDQGWYANTLWAGDPLDPNFLVVGGLDLHRSTNGGTTTTKISDWEQSPQSAHADHHVIAAHPAYDGVSNTTVYCGNDGGVYRTANLTAAQPIWQELNNGLGITQFYGAAGSPTTGQIVGGAQDNGTVLYTPASGPPSATTGPEGYVTIYGGDGGYAAADPRQATFYGEYVYLQIHRSQGGAQSVDIYNGIADAGDPNSALFIAPFILDPTNPDVMLAGGLSLWRSDRITDMNPTWSRIKQPFGTTTISAIAVDPNNPNLIWVGHENDFTQNSGAIFMTATGTKVAPTWTRKGKGVLPQRHCTRLVVDPNDSKHVFALFGGYEDGNLWSTADGGSTWSKIGSGSLPLAPFYDLQIHPNEPNVLILGNEVGVFVSDNSGTTWSPTNQGPTNCAVFELFMMGTNLVAVTHGRGLFAIQLQSGPTSSALPSPSSPRPKQPIVP
jgi:photosystem II stability/assembly factor-like uncharacterized protein